MISVFLTSSPFGPLDNSYEVQGMDDKNGFPDMVRERWKEHARVLIISAFPGDIPANDDMRRGMQAAMEAEGLSLSVVDIWDDRTAFYSADILQSYDVIFLGGGHLPTENAYFHRIGLGRMLADYDGMIIGISAGTMNAASTVYVPPEEPGEAIDPAFQRFMEGLGLTDLNIVPHFQILAQAELDGLRMLEDIILRDSRGKAFLALPDGSFVLQEKGRRVLFGEAYVIADGRVEQICGEGERIPI